MPDTPAKSLLAGSIETVQGNLRDGVTNAEHQDWAAAQTFLTALVPGAREGQARRKAWRAAAVEPKPGVDEFPRHESVDALLAYANRQQTSGLATTTTQRFEGARKTVSDLLADIPHVDNLIAAIPKLPATRCQRSENDRARNGWDPDGRVSDIANALGDMANCGDDRLNDAARKLATMLETALRESRGAKVRGVREERPWHPDRTVNVEADLHIPLPHARYK